MVLTNAERQRRYKQRLKAQAAQATMTPARFDLLQNLRGRRDESLNQIALLEARTVRLHQTTAEGTRDISDQAIALERAKVAEVERLMAEFDPDDLTALPKARSRVEAEIARLERSAILPGQEEAHASALERLREHLRGLIVAGQ